MPSLIFASLYKERSEAMARASRLAASGASINVAMARIYRRGPRRSRNRRVEALALLGSQLDVPVRQVGGVQERKPLRVEAAGPGRAAEERRPSRPHGRAQELQVRLVWRAASLLQIAGDAATDDVLPGGEPSPAPWDDVIEVQLGARRGAPAVLAGVAVTRIDVQAREAHLGARQVIVGLQQDDTRDPQPPRGGPDRLFVDGDRQLGP